MAGREVDEAAETVKKLLVLGPSNVVFRETDASASAAELFEQALNGASGGPAWMAESRLLFYARSMARRADTAVEEVGPDAVLLTLISKPFIIEAPIARLRRLLPGLYPKARRIADWLKSLAGGNNVASPRGWLFRLPRWLLLMTIGGEPELDIDDAIAYAKATLDALVSHEDILVVCRLPFGLNASAGARGRRQMERVERFNEAVGEHCRKRHVITYERGLEMQRAGTTIGQSARDGEHADYGAQVFDAGFVSRIIVRAMEGEGVGEAGKTVVPPAAR